MPNLLVGQQVVQPNYKGIGPTDIGDDVYYLVSTVGEILYSRDKNDDLDDATWLGYGKWSDLSDGFDQKNSGYYIGY